VRAAAGAAGQAVGEADAALVAAAVSSEEALACDHPAMQAQALAVVSNLVSLAGARAPRPAPGRQRGAVAGWQRPASGQQPESSRAAGWGAAGAFHG